MFFPFNSNPANFPLQTDFLHKLSFHFIPKENTNIYAEPIQQCSGEEL